MKTTILAITLLIISVCNTTAQVNPKEKVKISIGTDGVDVSRGDKQYVGKKKKNTESRVSSTLGFDLGFNTFDNSDVNSTAFQNAPNNPSTNFIGTAGKENSLALNGGKSINVNLYPFNYSIHLYKRSINLITGLGVNFFNYRYSNDITFFANNPLAMTPTPSGGTTLIYNKNKTTPSKSKVAASYVTVPLMLQFKPNLGSKKPIVIGAGISAGYLLKGWYKAKGTDDGKYRDNISYAFNPIQINAIGEFGIDDRIRFFGSYSLTSLYKTGLPQQRPVTFGIRFFGL
jgi:Outer membrane protein beta-barrel domain